MIHIYYNDEIYKLEITYTINEIGDREKTFNISDLPFLCDIQPASEKSIEEEWGKDIEADYRVYCDEDLNVGDYVNYNNINFIIVQKRDWKSYKIYAIKEVDI